MTTTIEATGKLRLAILTSSLRGGGAERVVSLLLSRLADTHEASVVLLSSEGNIYSVQPGQKMHVLQGEKWHDWANVVRLPLLARQYRSYLIANHIDVSLSFLNRPNFVNCMVKRSGWPGKVIISERAVTSLFYRTGLKRLVGSFMIRRLYPHADAIIPISRGVEQDLRHSFGVKSRYHTIYNPIDINAIVQQPAAPKAERPFTFVCVARFDPQKNHGLLIDAFARLRGKARLQLVGFGPGMEAMRERVRQAGIEDRVEFLGFQADPISTVRNADAFVLSSDFEGLGNVILEALACSLPVISTDCFSGPREILAPGTDFTRQLSGDIELAAYGILTPIGDAALLSEAMERLMNDPDLRQRYSAAALQRARMFDVETIARAYADVIQEVLLPAVHVP